MSLSVSKEQRRAYEEAIYRRTNHQSLETRWEELANIPVKKRKKLYGPLLESGALSLSDLSTVEYLILLKNAEVNAQKIVKLFQNKVQLSDSNIKRIAQFSSGVFPNDRAEYGIPPLSAVKNRMATDSMAIAMNSYIEIIRQLEKSHMVAEVAERNEARAYYDSLLKQVLSLDLSSL